MMVYPATCADLRTTCAIHPDIAQALRHCGQRTYERACANLRDHRDPRARARLRTHPRTRTAIPTIAQVRAGCAGGPPPILSKFSAKAFNRG